MINQPLPRPLRWLLHACLAILLGLGLADLLIHLVERYESPLLQSPIPAIGYWLYAINLWEALALGLLGGVLIYWEVWDRIGLRTSW